MDIWQYAKGLVDGRDEKLARELGFDACRLCGEWFHHGPEDWVDCASCGRHCSTCAEEVDWVWCDVCGFTYCGECFGDGGKFVCPVCAIEI